MSCALPPVALPLNWVSEKGLVVMVALPAVALSVNESVKPPVLLRMTEFPAELALTNVIAPLLVKLGENAELLTTPASLISKSARLTAKEYAGAAAVNCIVPIDVVVEIVTDVGAALFVNVAVPSGTSGLELQLVPVVHWLPGPCQVPSVACAASGASIATAPSQTPPSNAVRRAAIRGRGAAGSLAMAQVDAAGMHSRPCTQCERMTRNSHTRAPPGHLAGARPPCRHAKKRMVPRRCYGWSGA